MHLSHSRIVITLLLAFALCIGAALQDEPCADESGVSQASISFLGNGVSTAQAKVHTQENHEGNYTENPTKWRNHAYTPDNGSEGGDEEEPDPLRSILTIVTVLVVFVGFGVLVCLVIWIWEKIKFHCFLRQSGVDESLFRKD